MKFRVKVSADNQGGYYALSLGEPECNATGSTRDEAIDNIRDEIRYRMEFCPCTWTPEGFVDLIIEE